MARKKRAVALFNDPMVGLSALDALSLFELSSVVLHL